MARIIVIFLLVLYSSILRAQSGILSKKIVATHLPKAIRLKGELLELWTWKDHSVSFLSFARREWLKYVKKSFD
ncbi:MAG: hypothetical protein ACXWC7_20415 [Chitinophagaceae bacterium]